MIHSHKTQILWFTSYKLHYACRWLSWHYNHHQLKRRIFFTWDGEKKAFCLLGEGRVHLLMSFAWYLNPTSWEWSNFGGFVAPFNPENSLVPVSRTTSRLRNAPMSPKVVRFGTSDMNFQEFHQKIPSRSFKRWWLVSFLLFSPHFPIKIPNPGLLRVWPHEDCRKQIFSDLSSSIKTGLSIVTYGQQRKSTRPPRMKLQIHQIT